jgi:hypothetical protein
MKCLVLLALMGSVATGCASDGGQQPTVSVKAEEAQPTEGGADRGEVAADAVVGAEVTVPLGK